MNDKDSEPQTGNKYASFDLSGPAGAGRAEASPLGALDVRFATHKSRKTGAEFFSRVRLSDAFRGIKRSGGRVREAAVSLSKVDGRSLH